MKKKGLIISTVVMVVVLIASLTTATYAWFSTTASAKIENLDVQTTAAKGLQIGLYTPDAEINSYSSGPATLTSKDGSGNWKGSGTSWGSTIDFSSNLGEGGNTYMAVSGDGIDMFTLANANDSGITSAPGAEGNEAYKAGDTAKIKDATVNTDFFRAYIALMNTESEAKKIVINKVTVTAKANDADYTGMAAALRIAVFATTTAPTALDSFNSTLKHVIAPFGNLSYNASNTRWTENTGADKDVTAYLKKPEMPTEYTSGTTTLSEMKKAEAALTGWHPMKGSAEKTTQPVTDTEESALELETSLGNGKILYLMVAVWFEGQDQECINLFAGGGASIAIEFGFGA